MNDDVKWVVYSVFLADLCFREDARPDPDSLEELLRDLGVSLEAVEREVIRLVRQGKGEE